jgi:hypothetical protein
MPKRLMGQMERSYLRLPRGNNLLKGETNMAKRGTNTNPTRLTIEVSPDQMNLCGVIRLCK